MSMMRVGQCKQRDIIADSANVQLIVPVNLHAVKDIDVLTLIVHHLPSASNETNLRSVFFDEWEPHTRWATLWTL